MTSVVDSLPAESRAVFAEVVGKADPVLLQTMGNKGQPSTEERESVLRILSAEFSRCLQPDDEPTERARLVDDTLGAFLLRWPIDRSKSDT